jgi:hypothetical protein
MRLGRFPPIVKDFSVTATLCPARKAKFFKELLFFAPEASPLHCEGLRKMPE